MVAARSPRPWTASALLAAVLVAGAAHADDKDKKKPKSDASVDAFFDAAPTKKSTMDELNKATAGVANKDATAGGMAPKTAEVNDDAPVKLHGVFAAQKIVMDKKLGCQPAGRDKKKLTYWSFDDLPETGLPFEVCLTLSSKVGREMSMSVSIVDPRNARVVRGEDVVDFRGRTQRMDHVLEFPAPQFKTAGPYFYVVELDGKEVGRLPIFEVQIAPEGAPPPTPAPAAPATATEP